MKQRLRRFFTKQRLRRFFISALIAVVFATFLGFLASWISPDINPWVMAGVMALIFLSDPGWYRDKKE